MNRKSSNLYKALLVGLMMFLCVCPLLAQNIAGETHTATLKLVGYVPARTNIVADGNGQLSLDSNIDGFTYHVEDESGRNISVENGMVIADGGQLRLNILAV